MRFTTPLPSCDSTPQTKIAKFRDLLAQQCYSEFGYDSCKQRERERIDSILLNYITDITLVPEVEECINKMIKL